ncbi:MULTISPECIES: endo-1,4-beta-xylanase [Thermoanaerobacterium]|uniref:Beta-xylanase n=2 Tax=Thermoanaerobacterium TaxID=28895 RepID=W9E8Q1_9THEO|nr:MULTISPECIES: endo-1,4-beta-xylanase [Thermoanaerobacterium]AFK86467.1 glycoside hydrolase family 10 [Thermoanaerobacterium saccharolyticum JW/SL-YS485]ETO38248.1 glycoside hydrolase family protein [Thermoanaerobacterium aotearoense SCUT27]
MNADAADKLKHRKGIAKIKLVKKDGSPIKDAEVAVSQVKHKFLFGCGAFDSLPLANGELKENDKEKIEDRFEKFFDLFNYATIPFYWGRFEPEKGKPDTNRLKKASEWLVSKGCLVKGHPLCWHTVTAPWLLDMSNEDILKAQLSRIKREASDFKGLVNIWDVINEVVIMPIFNKYDNGITRICKELGRIRLVKEVFNEAKKANPEAVLLINDFNTSISYEILIEGCLEAGIPIDAIGIQSHMHQGYWGVEKTLEVLERFSHFNIPLHFTENTLLSGHLMPPEIEDLNDYQISDWPSTPDGEERQATEVVKHYKTLFSHPMVESITWWNFCDENAWLGAPAGLLREDNSCKPSYYELKKLIKDEWWTHQTRLVTSNTGEFEFTGFLGEYELIINDRKFHFNLDKNDISIEITV